MRLSARNIIKGSITQINKGAVNTEVILDLPGGEKLVSVITNTSAESLELKVGKQAYAIIKASNIMIGVD